MGEVTWREIASGVHVRKHEELNLNCGLVVGSERALVIDTRSYHQHGLELLAAVRELTDRELVVVNTHGHYDHCFGNSAFRDSQIYAHSGCVEELVRTGERQREEIVAHMLRTDRPEIAADIEATEIVLPFYLVEEDTPIELGDRSVQLLHRGRGHTDHDLVVAVPDGGVIFAGDLVEEGADPHMEDAYPAEWGPTLHALLDTDAGHGTDVWVPGHGEVVDRAYVEEQGGLLDRLAGRLEELVRGGALGVDALVSGCRGLGLEDQTLRDAAVRTFELRA